MYISICEKLIEVFKIIQIFKGNVHSLNGRLIFKEKEIPEKIMHLNEKL